MTAPTALVSGGTGFVGRFVVERLLAGGYRVIVAGRNPPRPGFFSRPITFRPCDLGTGPPARLFAGVDAFVHAAFDHVPGKYRGGEGSDPDAFRRRNHDGSVALFEAAKASGVSLVVFLSSRAVYGVRAEPTVLTEDSPSLPDTLYGRVKWQTEQVLTGLAGPAFRIVSFRITGVYGPAGAGQTHKWAGPIADYLAGRPVEPRIGTEVHGEDVAAAVALVLTALTIPAPLIRRHKCMAIAHDCTPTPNPSPQGRGGLGGSAPQRQTSTVLAEAEAPSSPSPLRGGVRGGGTKTAQSGDSLAPKGEANALALLQSPPPPCGEGPGVEVKSEATAQIEPASLFNVSDLVLDRRDLLAIVKEITASPHPLPASANRSTLAVMATDRLRALGWNPGGRARLERFLRETFG